MIRLYVAAPIGRRAEAKATAAACRSMGYAVNCRWHDREEGADGAVTGPEATRIASENYTDCNDADGLVALVYPECKGTLVEVGLFRGWNKPTICVGNPECTTLMVRLPGIVWVDSAIEVIPALGRTMTPRHVALPECPVKVAPRFCTCTSGRAEPVDTGKGWVCYACCKPRGG